MLTAAELRDGAMVVRAAAWLARFSPDAKKAEHLVPKLETLGKRLEEECSSAGATVAPADPDEGRTE